MIIFIVLVSIYVITGLVWLVRRFTPIKVCPICAGVSLTWLWMLVGVLTNQLPITNYQLPIAILMGGSVVGIAYQLEKKLLFKKSALLWKVLFVPAGFLVVYSLNQNWWLVFGGALVFMLVVVWIFFSARGGSAFGGKKPSKSNFEENKSLTFLRSIKPRREDSSDAHSSLEQAEGYSGKVRDKKQVEDLERKMEECC